MPASRRGLARFIMAAAVSALSLIALSSVPANATAGAWCDLKIGDAPPKGKDVSVSYVCQPYSYGDIQWQATIWGEDLFSDNRLYTKCLHPYEGRFWVHPDVLNEDVADRDEIYVRITFKTKDGKFYSVASNTVKDWWGSVGGFTSPTPTCSRQPPAA